MNSRAVITSAASAAQAAGHAAVSARIGMFAPSGLLEEIPGTARAEIPSPVSIAEALAVAGRARYYTDPVFPDCFVCGIGRRPGDGLRIFPAPVAGRPLWAAPWTPDPSVASADGRVRPEVVWGGARLPQRDRRRRGRQSGGGHCHHARPDDGQSDGAAPGRRPVPADRLAERAGRPQAHRPVGAARPRRRDARRGQGRVADRAAPGSCTGHRRSVVTSHRRGVALTPMGTRRDVMVRTAVLADELGHETFALPEGCFRTFKTGDRR